MCGDPGKPNYFHPDYKYPDPPEGYPGLLKTVFSGTPRGATFFLWRLLQGLGIPNVGHEGVFFPSWIKPVANWRGCVVDVTGFAWPYVNHPRSTFTKVHIVRHPVSVICSSVIYFPKFFPDPDSQWRWVETYWFRAHATPHPGPAYQVEKYADWLPGLAKELWGVDWTRETVLAKGAETKRNALNPKLQRYTKVTWKDLRPETRDLAAGLGYTEEV